MQMQPSCFSMTYPTFSKAKRDQSNQELVQQPEFYDSKY